MSTPSSPPPRCRQHPRHPEHCRNRRNTSVRGRGEAGSASAELVIATPVLLLLILCVVQFALWQHASHVAQAAAQQGLAAARVQGGGPAAGQGETQAVLAQLGTTVLVDPRISSRVGVQGVVVTVSGHAEAVVPFLRLPVRATAVGPVERFTKP